jgi:hypothetical protein
MAMIAGLVGGALYMYPNSHFNISSNIFYLSWLGGVAVMVALAGGLAFEAIAWVIRALINKRNQGEARKSHLIRHY